MWGYTTKTLAVGHKKPRVRYTPEAFPKVAEELLSIVCLDINHETYDFFGNVTIE